VTLLQLAMAYGAVANGGMLMKPMIVAEKRFPDGSVEIAEPREVRRVISPRTAQLLTECFTEVVESGTGTSARIAGMPIAGKTGTAEIRDPATGKYSKTDFNASFVGYFPSISPRYLIVANICKPKGIHYGGDVAAPVFKNVAERIIGRNPGLWRLVKGSEASREEELVNIPEMTDGRLSIAMAKLSRASLRYRTIGSGDYVYDQDPPANTPGHPRDIVTLVVGPARGGKNTVVPLMTDQSLRDALEKGTKCGLKVQLHGSGRVLRQEPQAGTLVPTGKATNVYGEES